VFLGRDFFSKELVWRGEVLIMKKLFLLLALSSCQYHGEKFYSKECIYHSWLDGKQHCPRYNLIRIKNDK